MEGVGARLGRSSARYAPTTVFSGPVRRWKKKWVPLSNRGSSNSSNTNHSHLLLYRWTPATALSSATSAATPPSSGKDAISVSTDDAHRRKFRYIPVSILEQINDGNVKSDDESKPDDVGTSLQAAQGNGSDGKTEGSDVLMEEVQGSEMEQSQSDEPKETNLDLSLALKAHDNHDLDNDPKSSLGATVVGQPEWAASSGDDAAGLMKPSSASANSESELIRKRKPSSSANLEMRM